jgi:hypothetical protein
VGQQINEYAGAEPDQWAATMERALVWDAKTHNGFEPKAPCERQIAEQRQGLTELRQYILANKKKLRAGRTRNRLDND